MLLTYHQLSSHSVFTLANRSLTVSAVLLWHARYYGGSMLRARGVRVITLASGMQAEFSPYVGWNFSLSPHAPKRTLRLPCVIVVSSLSARLRASSSRRASSGSAIAASCAAIASCAVALRVFCHVFRRVFVTLAAASKVIAASCVAVHYRCSSCAIETSSWSRAVVRL